MTTTIQKWGNSQGIRIPKILLDTVKWAEDEQIVILVQDNKQRQYYNLRNLIEENKGNIPVFWFYAVKSDYDIEQRKIIDELPIYKIAFDESIHGKSCFPTDCIPFILKTKDNLNLQYVLKSKVYNNISFSYKLFGITGIVRAIAHVIRKKKALFVK